VEEDPQRAQYTAPLPTPSTDPDMETSSDPTVWQPIDAREQEIGLRLVVRCGCGEREHLVKQFPKSMVGKVFM